MTEKLECVVSEFGCFVLVLHGWKLLAMSNTSQMFRILLTGSFHESNFTSLPSFCTFISTCQDSLLQFNSYKSQVELLTAILYMFLIDYQTPLFRP
jgi:hypothetical protein